ncbi:MAG: urea transporter [Fluviicola sp.]|nr:urea transporter [Fluviicola sp.]
MRSHLLYWGNSIFNSYAQLFFSLNRLLAVIIMAVTFIDPYLGICGLSAVVLITIFALVFSLSLQEIEKGVYGFNSLLLGLALGFEYKFNGAFAILFFSAVLLLLFHTLWLATILGKYKLPFLSLPFLFTYWCVYLAAGSFSLVELQEQYVYTANNEALDSVSSIYVFAHSLDNLALPEVIYSFFKTLSATFFQSSILAGIIIACGLLYFSRIAFLLSFLGFITAFVVFDLLGIPTELLTEHLIGSNFIFLYIALGAFYLVPNKWNYVALILLTPIVCMMHISLGKALAVFQLKAYTLSFSLLTILCLFFLHHRLLHRFLHLAGIQYYSAEKTIYKHVSATQRFKNAHLAKITLPFWGEWKVSQGYDGTITHLGEWSKALDFVIVNHEDQTYEFPGTSCEDFFCYNKPVLAPSDGYIFDIIDHLDDNEINEVDMRNNWGNTLILNHQNGLFSQLSHLKKDSIKVRVGEFVKRGTVLATCGNSGRSPEPHVHFQLQLTPNVGEKPIPYPFAYFLDQTEDKRVLRSFEVPIENTRISNVETTELLLKSYDFQPGRTLRMMNIKTSKSIEWKIATDDLNRTFIHCATTKSTLWFFNDGILFCCYDFEGSQQSLLFDFYLANYRVLLGCYSDISLTDTYPLMHFSNKFLLVIQDIIAPFYLFIKAEYKAECVEFDSPHSPKTILYRTKAVGKVFNQKIKERTFEILFDNKKMHQFKVYKNDITHSYLCELY